MTTSNTQQKGFKISTANSFQYIRGHHECTKDEREACYQAIASLNGKYADLWRGAGTILSLGKVRIDLQGKTQDRFNIQVQIGNKTVATALIDKRLSEISDMTNRRGVENKLISALNQSMDSKQNWYVNA